MTCRSACSRRSWTSMFMEGSDGEEVCRPQRASTGKLHFVAVAGATPLVGAAPVCSGGASEVRAYRWPRPSWPNPGFSLASRFNPAACLRPRTALPAPADSERTCATSLEALAGVLLLERHDQLAALQLTPGRSDRATQTLPDWIGAHARAPSWAACRARDPDLTRRTPGSATLVRRVHVETI